MAELGVYGANIKIAVLMTLFIQMFRYAAEPFFFNNARKENSRQTIADTTKYFILFTLLIFLGITLYIDLFNRNASIAKLLDNSAKISKLLETHDLHA